ncbi:MAG: phosphoglucosamine mutase [Enterobacterales bacterium]
MNKNKYFGTDGIRGKVGKTLINPNFVLKLGWAIGKILPYNSSRQVFIGKDTRSSGDMIESALVSGLSAAGFSSMLVGYIPTPGIAYLTKKFKGEAGIVISASHNPFYDNGIKIFSKYGTKFSKEVEACIESKISSDLVCVDSKELGKTLIVNKYINEYVEFCKSTFPKNITLNNLKIIVDCANGSTYNIAGNILTDLGANVSTISCNPNGININQKCGATNTYLLRKKVLQEKADLGIAYDGDGDRVIMIDHLGNKIDGDHIIYIIVKDQLNKGKLFGGVVGTVMSNMGLELSLKKLNIPFIRSEVGNYFILKAMKENNWKFGSENSGHIILLDKTTTDDAIIVGLQILSILVQRNVSLYDLCEDIKLLPQKIVNVYYPILNDLFQLPNVKKVVYEAKKQLNGNGRILLRKSGTEPLIRIMVEGEDKEKISFLAEKIANVIKNCK